MLDDLEAIHTRDKFDALGVAEKQWRQLEHDFASVPLASGGEISNVVLAGMGGSALPGLFLRSWPSLGLPFEIVRDYELPSYVDHRTLFIACSYSGNTEEILAALTAAEAARARCIIIGAGGTLAERARAAKHPLILLPGGIQPRMCTFYIWKALVQLLEPLGIVSVGSSAQLAATGRWLAGQTASWLPEIPVSRNPAKQLALELMGRSVVVYSGPKLSPVATKWKICTNENAKTIAWTNQFPEYDHNEFIGWSGHPVDKPYGIIEIRSDLEHLRVQKRFDLSQRLLSGMRPYPQVIAPVGDSLVQQLAWTSNFADFVSIYLAILNGVDPTPVNLVEKLKSDLRT